MNSFFDRPTLIEEFNQPVIPYEAIVPSAGVLDGHGGLKSFNQILAEEYIRKKYGSVSREEDDGE